MSARQDAQHKEAGAFSTTQQATRSGREPLQPYNDDIDKVIRKPKSNPSFTTEKRTEAASEVATGLAGTSTTVETPPTAEMSAAQEQARIVGEVMAEWRLDDMPKLKGSEN